MWSMSIGWRGGRDTCAGMHGGARVEVGWGWNGERVGWGSVVQVWEAWKGLHWLSKMDTFSFHSSQVMGMGCSW